MKEYYLLFQNSKNKRWWNFFTTDGFEHCDILQYNKDTKQLIYLCGEYDYVTLESNSVLDIEEHLHKLKSYGIIIIKVKKEQKIKIFMIGTCVGLCKKFLGIRNPFIITPYQLYKYGRKKWQIQ